MLTSKKGISAMKVQRVMGFGATRRLGTCATASAASQDKEFRKLMGIVEVDETFIGGKVVNRHRRKRGRRKQDGTLKIAWSVRSSARATSWRE